MPVNPTTTLTYTNTLQARYPKDVRTLGVRLPGGLNLTAGTILGEQNIVTRNAVQTVTISGSPTGGTFTLTTTDGQTTGPVAYNITTANLLAALQALLGTSSVASVTGTAGTSYVITFSGDWGNRNISTLVATSALTGGTTPAATCATTTVGSAGPTGTAGVYAHANSDGTQVPRYLLMKNVQTNARGMVIDQFNQEIGHCVEVAYTGEFFCSDMSNIAAVVAGGDLALIGKLTAGQATTDAGAVLKIGV